MVVWHSSPELISAFVILVLLLNSKTFYIELSTRDKLFSFLLYYTFVSFVINLMTVATVFFAQYIPLWINMMVNTLYFAIYPFMLDLLIAYILLYIYEKVPSAHHKRPKRLFTFLAATYVVYLVVVVINLWTGWLFYFNADRLYIQGIINNLPVYLALFHTLCGIVVLTLERQFVDSFFLFIISWFPIVSILVLIAQIIFPEIILSGTAMMVAILSIYLNFQTRKISLDNLTQLPNREYFVSTLTSRLKRGKKVSIILISLDDFKVINDTFGQTKGDACLKTLATEVQSICNKGQLFRYGGDDFVLMVPTNEKKECVKQIRKRLTLPWEVEGISTRLNATIVSIDLPYENEKKADPITLLDHTKRYAKSHHKGRYLLFDDSMLKAIRRKQIIVNSLFDSIENNTLRVVYQPIICLETGKANLFEALLRMNDTDLQAISPGEFIPIAEELGIIDKLTLYVLKTVCTLQKDLDEKGLTIPSITVNFSASHFSNKKLLDTMLKFIDSHPTSKGKIIFEITESVFITTSFNQVLSMMTPFIESDIQFILDDFGTGYSNLSHMVNLPLKHIKMDKSLLWDTVEEGKPRFLLELLENVSKQMNIELIVEGVETKEQLHFLQEIKSSMAQGFLFSLPLEKEEFYKAIIKNRNYLLD